MRPNTLHWSCLLSQKHKWCQHDQTHDIRKKQMSTPFATRLFHASCSNIHGCHLLGQVVEDAAIIEQQGRKNVFQIIFRTIKTFYERGNGRRMLQIEN